MLNSLKASNILFVNDVLVPFWIMQGLLAQWDFQVGYSTEKLLDNRRFFGLRPFCILGCPSYSYSAYLYCGFQTSFLTYWQGSQGLNPLNTLNNWGEIAAFEITSANGYWLSGLSEWGRETEGPISQPFNVGRKRTHKLLVKSRAWSSRWLSVLSNFSVMV